MTTDVTDATEQAEADREDFAGWADMSSADDPWPPHDGPFNSRAFTGLIPTAVVDTPFTFTLCSRVLESRGPRHGGVNVGLRYGWPDSYRDNPTDLTVDEKRYVAGMLRHIANEIDEMGTPPEA